MDDIKMALNNFLSINGRVNRARFFLYQLLIWALAAGIIFIFFYSIFFLASFASYLPRFRSYIQTYSFFNYEMIVDMVFRYFIGCFALGISSIQNIKRFHDLDLPGWCVLFLFIPFYNLYYLFILYFACGNTGPNQYGDDPLQTPGEKEWKGRDIDGLLLRRNKAEREMTEETYRAGLEETYRAGLEVKQQSLLEEAYKATFGVSMNDPRVDKQTGQISGDVRRPTNMLEATLALQRLLVSQGIPSETVQRYVLCSIDTHAEDKGLILSSLVFRHTGMQPIQVVSKHTCVVTTFRPEDTGWCEPYKCDVNGRLVDEPINWTVGKSHPLKQDKSIATMMVDALKSIKCDTRSPDYWDEERRWISGETVKIIDKE